MNCIKDNPVTTEDIDIAETIFGPDIGVLKGKTTRQRPIHVVADYVDIPEELLYVAFWEMPVALNLSFLSLKVFFFP
jgi:hypothetical protein